MKEVFPLRRLLLAVIVSSLGAALAHAQTPESAPAKPAPSPAAIAASTKALAGLHSAPHLKQPHKAPVMAATTAGKRIVAVGDYGLVLLSDDGKQFRQPASVPTRAALTSVFFLNDQQGWAAGHDGTVLSSNDGGDSWQLLREERGKERVLLGVWFENATHGLVIGQFGLVLETDDGGKSWRERRLLADSNKPAEREADEKHLLNFVPAAGGLLLIAAEAGAIFRSEDHGRTWQLVQTDNKGSFWTGLALADGGLLMAGMRGHVYRSDDRGRHWQEQPFVSQQSLTAGLQRADGSVRLVGASGVLLDSKDGGRSFKLGQQPERAGLSAIAAGPAGDVLFSLQGVVAAP